MKAIRQALNNFLKVNVTIRKKTVPKHVIDKKLFIESIQLLQEIDDRSRFTEEELGIDLNLYQEKYFQVIENLFRMYFNKDQVELVIWYLYQAPDMEDWDGYIDLTDSRDTVRVKFKTPEDVWEVVSKLSTKTK